MKTRTSDYDLNDLNCDVEFEARRVDEGMESLQALWAAVLQIAVMDYQYGLRRELQPPDDPTEMRGLSAGALLRRRERILDWARQYVTARAWLNSPLNREGSFVWICEVLDWDPVRTLKRIKDPALFDQIKHHQTGRFAPLETTEDEDGEA
jgi:hypothetical protein